ncbi:peptidase M3A and M3B thimet/oligopeptidase F [Alkalihalophilus marmarensis]|uniref:peptidase M3A and M3B thimet/oligopeptidase F n=1 Tax=Alkalihalophilus marmarensis TaxID=521377 RepID=UPI002E1FE1F7|nr:M3 family metallopeptidase [Alkalihalophilus marmarensis]
MSSQTTINVFLEEQNRKIEALYKPVLISHWMAATTGEKEWSEKHKKALSQYFANFSDPKAYKAVLSYREDKQVNPLQRRQLDDLYNMMVKNQLDPSITAKTMELEKAISHEFNTYRPILKGKEVTNNEILDILKTSIDSEQRKGAWLASKQIGKKIENTVLQLVYKRNKDAQALGYDNFYKMSLDTQELNIDELFKIFNKLKVLSDEPFRRVKDEIDAELSIKLGVTKEKIRPWHYVDPFFQEAPPVSGIDLDQNYKNKNLEQIVISTFESMGLDIKDILQQSDLYPRDNKNPFGFCTNTDRRGDIRVLVNIDESVFWATALLHEFGHAAYFKYIDEKLPFILRFHSHSLTTEAIAMFFGRMTKRLDWQQRFLKVEQLENLDPSIKKMMQRQMLVNARWIITFCYFEKEMYENPDQDLNKLWWELVQEIQFISPPEDTSYPDWASKMHFSLAPVTYQDYMLGELTASQLQIYIENNIANDLFVPEVGLYLKEYFFKDGALLNWNEKIKRATGENLNPRYFINQFL